MITKRMSFKQIFGIAAFSLVFILFIASFFLQNKIEDSSSKNFLKIQQSNKNDETEQIITQLKDFVSDLKFGLQVVNEGLLLMKEEESHLKQISKEVVENSRQLLERGKRLRADVRAIANEVSNSKKDLNDAKNSFLNALLNSIEDKIESSVEKETESILEKCEGKQNMDTRNVSLIVQREKSSILEFFQRWTSGKDIILTICNSAWIEFVSNWRCSLEALGLNNYLMIAMDEEVHQLAQNLGIHSYLPAVSYGEKQLKYRTKRFNNFVKIKSMFVLTALELGYNVLLSDVDIVFLKDPLTYFKDLGNQWDAFFQSDASIKTANYMVIGTKGFLLNSGFYYVKSNSRTIEFFKHWVETEFSKTKLTEQEVLNALMRKSQSFPIAWRLLRRELFPNGSVFFRTTGSSQKIESPNELAEHGRHLLEFQAVINSTSKVNKNVNDDEIDILHKNPFLIKVGENVFQEKRFDLKNQEKPRNQSYSVDPYMVHANWMVGGEMKKMKLHSASLWLIGKDLLCTNKLPESLNYEVPSITQLQLEEEYAYNNLKRLYSEEIIESFRILPPKV